MSMQMLSANRKKNKLQLHVLRSNLNTNERLTMAYNHLIFGSICFLEIMCLLFLAANRNRKHTYTVHTPRTLYCMMYMTFAFFIND